MKKIIDGKSYNTETAEKIGSDDYLYPSDFKHWEEALYKTTKGVYFIAGSGGPASHYAHNTGDCYTGGSGLRVVSEKEAREWAERHLEADVIEHYFEIEEG